MDISQLGAFSQVKMADNSRGVDVLRLGADGSIHSGGKFNEHNVFRRVGRDATGNSEVRAQFLKALGDTYGIRGAEVRKDGKISFSKEFVSQLKGYLGDTLKLKDFGIDRKTGLVTSGKPLTERRIVAIVSKVYNHAVAAFRERQNMNGAAQVKEQIRVMHDAARSIAEHEMVSGYVKVEGGALSKEQFNQYVADFKGKFSSWDFCQEGAKRYGLPTNMTAAIQRPYLQCADLLQKAVEAKDVSGRQAMRLMYMLTDGLTKWGKADETKAAQFSLGTCKTAIEMLKQLQDQSAAKELVRQDLSRVEDAIVKFATECRGFLDPVAEQAVADDLAAFEESVDARIRHEVRAQAPEPAPKAVGAKSVMRLEANPKALLDVFAGKLEKMGLKFGEDYSLVMRNGGVKFKFGSDADVDQFVRKLEIDPTMKKLAGVVTPRIKNLELDLNVTVENGKIRVGLENKTLPDIITNTSGVANGVVEGLKDGTLNAAPDLILPSKPHQHKEMVKAGWFSKKMEERDVDDEYVAFTLDPKEIFAELRESSGADLAITGFGVSEKGIACEFGVRTGEPVKEIEPKGAAGGSMASVHVSYDGLNDTMKSVFENAGIAFRPNGGVHLESRNGDLMRLTLTGIDVRNTIGGKVGFGAVNNIAQTVIGSSADRISIDVTPRFNPVTHQMELHFMDADSSGPTGRFLAGLVKSGFGVNKIVNAKGLPEGVGIVRPQTADLSKVPGSRFAVTIDVDNLLGKGETVDLFKGDLSRLNIKPVRGGLDVTFGERRAKTVSARNASAPSTSDDGFLTDFVDVSQS